MRLFANTTNRVLAVLLLVAPLAGCRSDACGGPSALAAFNPPNLVFQFPVKVEDQPLTIPGPRGLWVPNTGGSFVMPSYQQPAANACGPCGAPAMTYPGYFYTPGPSARVVDPCAPGGVPQSIPAIR